MRRSERAEMLQPKGMGIELVTINGKPTRIIISPGRLRGPDCDPDDLGEDVINPKEKPGIEDFVVFENLLKKAKKIL
jgi:hypothetical protein